MISIGNQAPKKPSFLPRPEVPGTSHPISGQVQKSGIPFKNTAVGWGPFVGPTPLARKKVEKLALSSINFEDLSRPSTPSPSVSPSPPEPIPTEREPEAFLLPPSAVSQAKPPLSMENRKLMISHPEVAECLIGQFPLLKEVLPTPFNIGLDPTVDYGRDCRVCLPTGEHYIPFEIQMDLQEADRFSCMILTEDDRAQGNSKYGRGFTEEYRNAAISHAKNEGIPIKQNTRSCVEGGNCRIVVGKDGQPKAYLGYNSLILTIIALENQRYFEESEAIEFLKEYMSSHPDPEHESFRVAYNLLSHHNRPGKTSKNGVFNPCHKIFEQVPPGLMRQKNYIEAAQLFEAKKELAKRIIAKDLGIPHENIIYLQQGQFHIDMESFATPDNVVFLHDDRESLTCLSRVRPLIEEEDLEVLNQYVKQAIGRYKSTESRNKKNKEALEKAGCRVILVGGDFQATETRINFMNGLMLQNKETSLFITNGTMNNALNLFIKAYFLDTLKKACPSLKVIFAADQTSLLQNMLSKYKAGIHCITWINSPPPNPNQEEEKNYVV